MTQTWDSIKCNILLLGKTGVGKSSFANYLFNTEIFTTGSGEPVTGWENNFQHHHFDISDISIHVYDSVGLEANNSTRWMRELDNFLSERQCCHSGSVRTANDIIHTLFYVINAALARAETAELATLKNLCKKYNLSASVIITNCDLAKEAEILAVESKIKEQGLISFRVCSVSKKTRGGECINPFGKEPAIRQILSDSYEKVGKELTVNLLRNAITVIDDAGRSIKDRIDESNLSIFNIGDADLDFLADDILPNDISIEEMITPEYKSYQNFLEGFHMDYQGRDIMNETIDSLVDILGSMDENSIQLGRKFNKILRDIEDGNFFEKAGAIFESLKLIIMIKKTLKDGVDELFRAVTDEVRKQLQKVESTTLGGSRQAYKQEDLVEHAVDDLKSQMDADKNTTINVGGLLQRIYGNNNEESRETLRKHMGNDIVFTGSWDHVDEQQIDQEMLLPGELSAVAFQIGGYTVRYAQRVYQKLDDSSEIPADQETVEAAKERSSLSLHSDANLSVKQEISAKYHGDYIELCEASHGLVWSKNIHYVCSILTPPLFLEENELLFVNNHYIGDSFSSETWYAMNRDGVVTHYRLHPFDPDSYHKSWNETPAATQ